jgi:DNA polymerase elongation subunit (family B)
MTTELRDLLFLDIETVAKTDDYEALGDRMKGQWARKASFFKSREPQQTDEAMFHERAGIYAEFGKIIVIGVGKFTELNGGRGLKTKVFYGHDEKKILLEFKAMLDKMDAGTRLCAHNGKEFDFPYLSRRMLVHGIPLPGPLNLMGKKSWDIPHVDTMEMWKFGDHKHYTSLDLLTAIFEIPTSKTVMDGSRVNEVYYHEKNLEKITQYCVEDVIAVAQLYLRMKGLEILSRETIQSA